MKESILHYVWQNKLFPVDSLMTTGNVPLEVIDAGHPNIDAGPDFFNAKIKIGGTVWAGNVEIHTNSSDWNKHGHQHNKAYDSVILHVVKNPDRVVYRTDGSEILQVKLPVPAYIEQNYIGLLGSQKGIACSSQLSTVPLIVVQSWKSSLLVERLEQKTGFIECLLQESNGDWEEAFYTVLARNFGFGLNSQPFELLAKSLPMKILAKHKDQLIQLEALLFGQAGLLPVEATDEYTKLLSKEYSFLRSKYELQSGLDASQWKLLRLRPSNFPYIRIAQFAALIHTTSKLFSKIIEESDVVALRNLFNCEPSAYWKTHYNFSGEIAEEQAKKLGNQSVDVILINTVVPFLFYYASQKGRQEMKDNALLILEKIPPERNAVITGWRNVGLECRSAYDSQALLQLKKQYCDNKKCLRCRIGHKVLTIKPETAC